MVGLLQKLGTNRISARSLLVWLTVGFLLILPWFLRGANLFSLGTREVFIGILAGVINGMGSWFLFASLEAGAKASVAIPLTALYPLVTILFATLFLAETLSSMQWVGIVLALAGGVMLSYETEGTQGASS
ncbi:MAG: DMT family transporter [Acidobacteria bacterium]|nr:DMT family transporter [Acidobacteriota bacterium]